MSKTIDSACIWGCTLSRITLSFSLLLSIFTTTARQQHGAHAVSELPKPVATAAYVHRTLALATHPTSSLPTIIAAML